MYCACVFLQIEIPFWNKINTSTLRALLGIFRDFISFQKRSITVKPSWANVKFTNSKEGKRASNKKCTVGKINNINIWFHIHLLCHFTSLRLFTYHIFFSLRFENLKFLCMLACIAYIASHMHSFHSSIRACSSKRDLLLFLFLWKLFIFYFYEIVSDDKKISWHCMAWHGSEISQHHTPLHWQCIRVVRMRTIPFRCGIYGDYGMRNDIRKRKQTNNVQLSYSRCALVVLYNGNRVNYKDPWLDDMSFGLI